MCLGTTAVILEIRTGEGVAIVDYGDGVPREAVIGISGEDLSPGDIVIVHAGVVISKLRPEDAIESMRLMIEAAEALAGVEEAARVREAYERILRLAEQLRG